MVSFYAFGHQRFNSVPVPCTQHPYGICPAASKDRKDRVRWQENGGKSFQRAFYQALCYSSLMLLPDFCQQDIKFSSVLHTLSTEGLIQLRTFSEELLLKSGIFMELTPI